MNPSWVPSFGFDENVGMTNQGDSFFPSVVVVADTTAGAVLGDVTCGSSAANIADGANIIAVNNNSDRTADCFIVSSTLVSIEITSRHLDQVRIAYCRLNHIITYDDRCYLILYEVRENGNPTVHGDNADKHFYTKHEKFRSMATSTPREASMIISKKADFTILGCIRWRLPALRLCIIFLWAAVVDDHQESVFRSLDH